MRRSTCEEGFLFPLNREETSRYVRAALDEDNAFQDITTIAIVRSERRARCSIIARESGVVAGIPLVCETFRQLDPSIVIRVDAQDGQRVAAEASILFVNGSSRAILSGERVALNFLQHLSGIATLTARYVEAVSGTSAKILDTRKTTPGWRRLEKFAVRAGGGVNHRMDLASAVLIKDNHLAAVEGDVALAIRRARDVGQSGIVVEVECDTLDQVGAAVEAGADIILLDNMDVPLLRRCVEAVAGRARMEASGGVTLSTVRAIAETGVDWISVGALTHSAPAFDVSLDFQE